MGIILNRFEVVLNGGLGNQLFGWATGTSIAKKNNIEVIFNSSQIGERGYQLDKFGIFATENLPLTKNPLNRNVIKKIQNKILGKHAINKFEFAELSFSFDNRFLKPRNGVSFYGYFQSWKYFDFNRNEIISKLNQIQNPSGNYGELQKLLKSDSFITIHIRRGDYINKTDYHGLVDVQFFNKAREVALSSTPGMKFVCFSDSIEIAKNMIPWADYFISSVEIESPAETLMLMKSTEGIIGSNSSFSWWAGYLMKNENIKIFPKQWFVNKQIDTVDLIPLTWNLI